jgi:SUKH-3 immunity protein
MSEAARRAQEEFGGLRFDGDQPGEECASTPFEMDPMLAVFEEEVFHEYQPAVGQLFPLGEAGRGRVFLGIDEGGRVYFVSDDYFELAGDSIYDAVEAMVVGRRSRRVHDTP